MKEPGFPPPGGKKKLEDADTVDYKRAAHRLAETLYRKPQEKGAAVNNAAEGGIIEPKQNEESKVSQMPDSIQSLRAEIRDLEAEATQPGADKNIEPEILKREDKLRTLETAKHASAKHEAKANRIKEIRQRLSTLEYQAAHPAEYSRNHDELENEVLTAEKELRDLESAGRPVEGTPKELRNKFRDKLRKLIGGVTERLNMGERAGRLQAYFAERSKSLNEKAEGYGPKIAAFIGSGIEKYNKLHWLTKLTITGGLVAGVSLTSMVAPIVSGILATTLYGQRVVGAAGFAINKRKKIDAKIAENSKYWLANKSETMKNTYATVFAAVYMGGTAFAVHEGVEALNALGVNEWFGNAPGPDAPPQVVAPTKPEIPDASPAPAPTETPAPETLVPDESATELTEARAVTDRAFANLKERVAEAQKLASEQQVAIDKALEAANPPETTGVPDDLGTTGAVAGLDADQRPSDALDKIKAEKFEIEQHVAESDAALDRYNAANDLTDEFNARVAELDTKIEDALGRHNALLDEYGAAGREAIESNQRANQLHTDANSAFENAKEHMEKYKDIIKNTKDSDIDANEAQIRAEIRGDQEVLERDAEEAAKAYDDAEAIIDDKFKRAEYLKSQAADAKNAYEDLAAQKKAAFEALNADKPLESILPASPAEQQSDSGDISGAEQAGRTSESPFGRDANGHPFPSEQEAKDYDDLIHKGIRDPRETGAWPPEPSQEKGFLDKISDWFKEDKNTTEMSDTHFETNASGLAVDTAHANAYLDAQGNHIIFGGSLEDRMKTALQLAAKDRSIAVYFDSTRPGGLFGWFQEHHLSKAYSPEGSALPQIVDDIADATLRGVNLPSIDDLKEVYKPIK